MKKKVLITGGTGTLGQALVKAMGDDYDLTIYSRSELKQAQMRRKWPHCRYVLGDVRDFRQLEAAIAGHDTVIHAAAMKRIPECEAWPALTYEVNVVGSDNVAHACRTQGVERCVGISTDKACMAVTSYGASKLMMEKIFQANGKEEAGETIFTLVRYGNVLQSNGSVIELWRRCQANGDPLPITDREMTRFWMTPQQAVTVVMEALGLEQGQIYVPKCKALCIITMAHWIAPDSDVTEIGLRSMERLHEYLVSSDEFATEYEDHFVLGPGGQLGEDELDWNSFEAPELRRTEFEQMLAEVENE